VSSPYVHSHIIDSIVFDWSSHIRLAPGSDNWPVTWADDDHQYTSWGDGGGFGGSNSDGRVSLGVARVEGSAASYKAVNVWGGKKPEYPSQFDGKSYGIISIDGVLYKWVSPGTNVEGYQESRLYVSKDHAATWMSADWAFDRADGIVNPTFSQFGKDYQGARDEYAYIYANHIMDSSRLTVQVPGEIALMRVPKAFLVDRSRYEFFTGYETNGQPLWSKQFSNHQPVFFDKNGVGWNTSVSYNAGLKRYLLITEHTETAQANIGVFDAPEPWGPWSTVYYGKFGGESDIVPSTFFYNFSNKWLSNDGLRFVLLFTGVGKNDAWNTVSGEFILATPFVTSDPGEQVIN
jgi:hypothetical protein